MIDSMMPEFSVSPGVMAGLVGFVIAFGLFALVAKALSSGGRMMRVPPGVHPAKHYQNWRNASITKRLGQGVIIILGAAIGLTFGSLVALIIGIAS